MKRSFRIFILKILAVVLCCAYVIFICICLPCKTELPTKAVVTNRGAAVYTLRGQKQMLSQKEDFSYLPLMGEKKRRNMEHMSFPG